MSLSPQYKEKRAQRRLPAANLKAHLKRKQGLFTRWSEIEVVDFNMSGLALKLPSEPEFGDKLNFKLILEMDIGDIKVNQLLELLDANKNDEALKMLHQIFQDLSDIAESNW